MKKSGKKFIGTFGFVHENKGTETAIKTLLHLPSDYELLVVGGVHPQAMRFGSLDQGYLTHMVYLVESLNLSSRVHFIGHLDDFEFNQALWLCDFVIFPYTEVGQSSSGPAAIALDLQKDIFCANNKCFAELKKYAKSALNFFEISNYLELAQKIIKLKNTSLNNEKEKHEYTQKFNIQTRSEIYCQLCKK